MPDQVEAGSVVQPDAAPAGAPASDTPSAANGSAAGSEPNPFSGLQDEGARKWVETKGYKSVDDVVTAAHSLEQRLGTVATVPAADAPKEEWDKFYARLPEDRRPVEAPDKLDFKRPEGLPEELPYNEELANASKPWMAEAGLSRAQAQTMHDKFVGWVTEQAQAQATATAQAVEKTHDDLVRDWGPMDSDGFKKNLALADRAVKSLGLVDVYKANGIMLADGSLTNAQIARSMQAVGEKMFADDSVGGGDTVGSRNPFKRDAKGERDLQGISALVKSDPEQAKRLAREAGEDPNVWLGTNPR